MTEPIYVHAINGAMRGVHAARTRCGVWFEEGEVTVAFSPDMKDPPHGSVTCPACLDDNRRLDLHPGGLPEDATHGPSAEMPEWGKAAGALMSKIVGDSTCKEHGRFACPLHNPDGSARVQSAGPVPVTYFTPPAATEFGTPVVALVPLVACASAYRLAGQKLHEASQENGRAQVALVSAQTRASDASAAKMNAETELARARDRLLVYAAMDEIEALKTWEGDKKLRAVAARNEAHERGEPLNPCSCVHAPEQHAHRDDSPGAEDDGCSVMGCPCSATRAQMKAYADEHKRTASKGDKYR